MHISSGVTLGIKSHSSMFNNDSMFWLHPNIVICVWCRLGGVTSSRVYSLMTHKPNHWYHGMGCHIYHICLPLVFVKRTLNAMQHVQLVLLIFLQQEGNIMFLQDNVHQHYAHVTHFSGCWTTSLAEKINPPVLY